MALRRVSISLRAFVLVGLVLVVAMLAIALPGLHQNIPPRIGHYESDSRQWQAQQGRAIIANPQNPCTFYECNTSSRLRVCVGLTDAGDLVHALQWLWHDGAGWQEGTVFLQEKSHKVESYLRNNGCEEVVGE